MRKGNDMKYSIGIDIGGTKSAVLLGNPGENEKQDRFILHKEVFETKKPEVPWKSSGR